MPNSLREAGLDINETDLISVGRKKKRIDMRLMKKCSQCQGSGKTPEGFGIQVSLRWCSYIPWWPVFKQDSWLRKWGTTGNKKIAKRKS